MDYVKMDGLALSTWITQNNADDTYDRLRYLNPNSICDETHYLCRKKGKMVGVLSVQVNPRVTTDLWIMQVAVDPAEQGQGISRELIKTAFADIPRAYPQIETLSPSSFTEMGRARLKANIENHAHLLGTIEIKFSPHADFEDEPEEDDSGLRIS